MKYIVLLGDGMADYPVPELGGSTPLEVADKPYMDFLAQHGVAGMVRTVPYGMPPGSDVANLSVIGYNPEVYYTGRSPLEAASIGVKLAGDDIAFRCNLVSLSEQEDNYCERYMLDYSSDEIETKEAAILIAEVQSYLQSEEISFYPGVSYRHLMVWQGGLEKMTTTPPHDISERQITSYLPEGLGGEVLLTMMAASYKFLSQHPINLDRKAKGLKPANSIWLWGQGRKPELPLFHRKYGLRGAMVSAVDLTKGLGICAGLQVIEVPGATGNINTNFEGKAEAALKCLHQGCDFVYIHVEAPDEAGHRGELETKIKAIEAIDNRVLKPLLDGMSEFEDFKIMLLPDHPTPMSIRTHVDDPVPFVIYHHSRPHKSGISSYCEETARNQEWLIEKGYTLMSIFLGETDQD
ncbi:MAG: cofactor-independent phosphoglycerate mutase [Methylocystaceae bacterium]